MTKKKSPFITFPRMPVDADAEKRVDALVNEKESTLMVTKVKPKALQSLSDEEYAALPPVAPGHFDDAFKEGKLDGEAMRKIELKKSLPREEYEKLYPSAKKRSTPPFARAQKPERPCVGSG